uniref:Uncharacterized protein n=1 Tax=Nothobranchius furzeri TaxID=105023 RepID=A0A8C6KCK1_NOTFU
CVNDWKSRFKQAAPSWSALTAGGIGTGCGLSASSGGVSTALASVLIFTIVVDILGNVLVILSVYRNKKLRNAGENPTLSS